MKGSVVITTSLSPIAKSTDLAGESKLNVKSGVPDFTSHIFAVWSALPVISLVESPAKDKNYHSIGSMFSPYTRYEIITKQLIWLVTE